MDVVNFIVDNTYIAKDIHHVCKQTVGIPMGTNCASEIATLVLYVWEARYIDNLIANGCLEEAKKHKYTERFIDDIIGFNTDPIPREAYNSLEYSEQTNGKDGSVIFLGGKLQRIHNRLIISVFDKAKEWNFNVLRYSAAESNTPQHQAKGIFMGEVRRYQLMVNTLSAFKEATTALTKNMQFRGYEYNTISNAWVSFMKKFGDMFSHKKQKDLRRWFQKMTYWAFSPKERRREVNPPTPRPHQQQAQQMPRNIVEPNNYQVSDDHV